jgi:hypothetical protein
MYRAKIEAGEMTEAEAEAILGKSVWEAQGKIPAMWPTPTVDDSKNVNPKPNRRKGLVSEVMRREMWPTPRSSSAMAADIDTVRRSPRVTRGFQTFSRLEEHLARRTSESGKLNPMWVEWLMGFPLGWTDLEDSETL